MSPLQSYKQLATRDLARAVLANTNYRVFLSQRLGCNHGFITNIEGSRCVSFQYDLGGIRFSGCYKSSRCGTGWVMPDVTYVDVTEQAALDRLFSCDAPLWATHGERVTMTTLEQMLATYGKSSMFEEVHHD